MTSNYGYGDLVEGSLEQAIKAAQAPGALGPYTLSNDAKCIGAGITSNVYRVASRSGTHTAYRAAKFIKNDLSAAWDFHMASEARQRLAGLGVVPDVVERFLLCKGTWAVFVMPLYEPINYNESGAYTKYANSMRRCLREFHNAGFSHGDVHAGNFMMDPRTGEAVLIDFGLTFDYIKAPTGMLPKLVRGKRNKSIRDWSWITCRVDFMSIASIRQADFLIDNVKLEDLLDGMSA